MANKPVLNVKNDSARSYAEFLDDLPAAIFRTTIEGQVVYCNQAFARMFGFDSAAELIDYPVIRLYQNKKDRGILIHSILQRGRLVDLPVACKKKDGTALWCAVTVQAGLDDDGTVVHLDGIIRDITADDPNKKTIPTLDENAHHLGEGIVIISLQGELLDINKAGAEFFGLPRKQILGQPLHRHVLPDDRDFFLIFLSDILKIGRSEAILSTVGHSDKIRHLECHAYLVKNNGKPHHIRCIARDVTAMVDHLRERSKDEKFQGVLEMAGGVAHRLNQPLTIINNLLNEVMVELHAQDPVCRKLMKVHHQINQMNEIIKKIGNIKKYEAMEYVAGIKIVDIDKAS